MIVSKGLVKSRCNTYAQRRRCQSGTVGWCRGNCEEGVDHRVQKHIKHLDKIVWVHVGIIVFCDSSTCGERVGLFDATVLHDLF